MPKVGDRVIIEGSKIGQQRREGSLVGITGRLLNVRWNDGSTSLMTPGAGSVRFLPGKGKAKNGSGAKAAQKKAATRKPVAKKPGAKGTTKASAKKSAPKKPAAKKKSGKKK